MARRTLLTLFLAAWFAGSVWSAAQSVGAAKGHTQSKTEAQPAPLDHNIAQVTLGQSAVPLYGPWRFTVGDSPIDPKTGQPLWAEPGFDDSKWETVDLTPKDGAFDPIGGTSGYVPGWTAKGHPGYFGYAWYRLRVQVQVRPGEALALVGPADVDDAYQVFENGELAGHFGNFSGGKPVVYFTQPKMFPLSQPGSHDAGAGPAGTRSDGDWPTRVCARFGLLAMDGAWNSRPCTRCRWHA
jgi:hypothetical protein